MYDVGLLVLRLVLGLYLCGHGVQKLFGWLGGHGLTATTGLFGMLGFRPASFWVVTASVGELIGGALVALGFLNPLGSLAIAASMAVATAVHWPKGPWALDGGFELPLTDFAIAVSIGLMGPGRYSLDASLRTSLPTLLVGVLTVVAVLSVLAALASRRQPAVVASASESA
jgi:putative oxidoreductase